MELVLLMVCASAVQAVCSFHYLLELVLYRQN
jgi:hypothetical protein